MLLFSNSGFATFFAADVGDAGGSNGAVHNLTLAFLGRQFNHAHKSQFLLFLAEAWDPVFCWVGLQVQPGH